MRLSDCSTSVSGRATCTAVARAVREREDTHVRAVDRARRPRMPRPCSLRHGERRVVDRKLDVLPRRHEHVRRPARTSWT